MLRTEETRSLFRRALLAFGNRQQWDMVVEECAELLVMIQHIRRGRATESQLAEEIADALIMLEQARLMAGPAIVDRFVKAKLERLEKNVTKASGA